MRERPYRISITGPSGLPAKGQHAGASHVPLEASCVMCANAVKRLVGRDGLGGVCLPPIIGRRDLLTQPALHGGVAFLQCAKTGADHFTAGRVCAGPNELVDESSLL